MDNNFSQRWFYTFFEAISAAEDELGDLDRQLGDGDFGVNLMSGLRLAAASVDKLSDSSTPEEVFYAVSNAFLNTGGTSGPLLGMWFREIAKSYENHRDSEVAALADGVKAGTETVQRLGGAQKGDKTFVDTLIPVVIALEHARKSDATLREALDMAAQAATEGAESTSGIAAGLGRASYIGELALGLMDPGAKALAMFFHSGRSAAEV
ncbi:MAG: dihydroxyacetone kinase subunit DhaL [Microbacterium sp.]